MAKISNLPLRQSLVCYVLVFACLALLLSALTIACCDRAVASIWAAYPSGGEKYYLTNAQGEQLGDGVYVDKKPTEITARDERLLAALELVRLVCAPFYAAICIIAAAWLFYRQKLKIPLRELRWAMAKIAANDLDFKLQYANPDELGQLCAAFESMRARLAGNFAEMWAQMEERQRLNAAFAHDLRTPLTVLKGYSELLPPEYPAATAISRQIDRLERYTESMSQVQRLEQLQPEPVPVRLAALRSSLAENAGIICGQRGKELTVQWADCPGGEVEVDSAIVSRVANNLLANAARYAKVQVRLDLRAQGEGLLLTVADDGGGFTNISLVRAAEPYFSGDNNRAEHFGLGLYICKLLCQRHGGWLHIANGAGGGAEVQAFFAALEKN